MSNQNPRVALTVPKDLNATLQRLADLQGVPKTKIIVEMLEQCKPIFDQLIDALEQIQADKEKAPEIAKRFAHNLIFDGQEKLGSVITEVKKL